MDRMVHARSSVREVVHYNRAKKWKWECKEGSEIISLDKAVELALECAGSPGGWIDLGRPGGSAFDRAVLKTGYEPPDLSKSCRWIFENGDRCGKKTTARGFCEACYKRWQRTGLELGGPPHRDASSRSKECILEGCEGDCYARDLCAKHYNRFLRTGSTERIRTVNQGKECSTVQCDNPATRKGLCGNCYSNKRYHEQKAAMAAAM